MPINSAIILLLCSLVLLLLYQRQKQLTIDKRNKQTKKIIQLLQAYPVHEYTMPHMLERCLVMLFSAPQSHFLAAGAFFIYKDNQLSLNAQRGFNSLSESHQAKWFVSLQQALNHSTDSQFFPLEQSSHPQLAAFHSEQKSYYLLPLVRQKKLIAALVLSSSESTCNTPNISFLKSVSCPLATLIENKHFSDELRLGNNVMQLSHQSIFITNTDYKIIRCNKACEEATGYLQENLLGLPPLFFQQEQDSNIFFTDLCNAVDKSEIWQGEVWSTHKDKTSTPEWLTLSRIKDSEEETIQYLAIFTNLSSIKEAEKEIQKLSYFDPLTNLANRSLFDDRLQQSITQAERKKYTCSLLCVDIDHFKKVNDSLGHKQGDQLLMLFAQRIQDALRKADTVSRLSGDEFAIIINDCDTYHSAYIAKKIMRSLKEPIQLNDQNFAITASIGISCYPNDANNHIDLIKYAGMALFQAKKNGGNSFQFYTQKFNQQSLQKLQIESALRLALNNDYFELHFHPQFHLDSNKLIGAEALLRASQGELKTLSPGIYIPIAEETGLITEIGNWVFKQACLQVKNWQMLNLIPNDFKRFAINISPLQFQHDDFIETIQQTLRSTGVNVKHIEIELTESSLQSSESDVLEKLLALKALGINIAIDDFGTGYSSLSRLKNFPIDLLKIDRSFVLDICHNKSDLAIIKAIINMSTALDINTLAEGIENENQANVLNMLSCQYGQGFLFSKAINGKQFQLLLSESPADN